MSTAAEFRRWLVREHGAPQDVLELGKSVIPPATDGEMVIDVEACALNFADDLLCRGKYQEKPPLPFTPGLEFAGIVVDATPGARHERGDRVVGSALLPYGALAERCRARVDDAYRLPADIPAVDAVAMHVTYQTCWFALHRRARVQPNDTVLVHAGAGGVGSAAIQLAKAAGARVITTAGGPDKVARCVELGADLAIDHRTDDFVVAVNEATGGLGRRHRARSRWAATPSSARVTASRGKAASWWSARRAARYFSAPTNHVMVKNYSVVGVHWGGYLTRNPELVRGAHDDLMRLHRAGVVKPLVSSVVPSKPPARRWSNWPKVARSARPWSNSDADAGAAVGRGAVDRVGQHVGAQRFTEVGVGGAPFLHRVDERRIRMALLDAACGQLGGQGLAREHALRPTGARPSHRTEHVALEREVGPLAEHLDAAQARSLEHVVPDRRERGQSAVLEHQAGDERVLDARRGRGTRPSGR